MKNEEPLSRITTLDELRRRRIEKRRTLSRAAKILAQRRDAFVDALSPSNMVGGIMDGIMSLFAGLSRLRRNIAWIMSLFERKGTDNGNHNSSV